jgi:hypothetical protein
MGSQTTVLRDQSEPEGDRYFLLQNIPWALYEQLRERSGNGLRMTYVRGMLELMSPSFNHEDLKT